ncbi:MAG: adenosylhomocysteinase [Candidatus Marsarchaeota archaeon]|nr:adenosylhomocysteinase [Candidatus Marsarchaeota archaeon]
MSTLNTISEEAVLRQAFQGLRVGLVLHIEAKTAVLASRIQQAGAEVYVAASNPLTTQDDIVEALRSKVTAVWARRGEDSDEYISSIRNVLAAKPEFIIDDGADCIVESHRIGLGSVRGASEETTTGINRVKAMEKKKALKYPVVALNDALTKHLFDNRYGTGQSALDAFMRTTNLLVAGRVVLVVGFGWVGRGIAERLRGMGARVLVSEVDPVRAIEAYMEGFEVLSTLRGVKIADVVLTATGCIKAITASHFKAAKDGVIMANAGHFNVEIDVQHLEEKAGGKRLVRPNVVEYNYNGKRLYVISEGRLLNIAAADGHPIDVMDMSFAGQFCALQYLIEKGDVLGSRLVYLPRRKDLAIAKAFLRGHGLKIDRLSRQQRDYLGSF